MCNHDHRHVMVPSLPVATFIVIQAEFFFELVIILLDLPTALTSRTNTSQGVVSRKVAEDSTWLAPSQTPATQPLTTLPYLAVCRPDNDGMAVRGVAQKRDSNQPLVPSRQRIFRQALACVAASCAVVGR